MCVAHNRDLIARCAELHAWRVTGALPTTDSKLLESARRYGKLGYTHDDALRYAEQDVHAEAIAYLAQSVAAKTNGFVSQQTADA